MEELYRWYEERLEEGTVAAAWQHLQQCLFRRVRVSTETDMCTNGRPEDGVLMVLSKEHVARQVRHVIKLRERWLRINNFPLGTLMDSTQKGDFLTESKDQYHSRPEQKRLQERDAQEGRKIMQKRMRSRWNRHCQRLGGTIPMWQVLSSKLQREIRPNLLRQSS